MSCALCGAEKKDHGDKPHDYDDREDEPVQNTEVMVKLRDKPSAAPDTDESAKKRRRIRVGGLDVMEENKWGGWDVLKYYTMSVDDMRRLREALDHALALEEIDCKTVTVSTIPEE